MSVGEEKSAWDGYRRRRNLSRIGSCFFLLSWFVLFFAASGGDVFLFLAISGVLLAIPLYLWHCPACGHTYFQRILSYGCDFQTGFNPFRGMCAHCGLKKWQEPPAREKTDSPLRTIPNPMTAVIQKQRTFLTLVLRDDPGVIGLERDENGWVEIEDLLKRAKRNKIELERGDLDLFLIGKDGGFLEIGGFKNLVRYVEG